MARSLYSLARREAFGGAHLTLTTEPVGAKLVTEETTQYRGALPPWRVEFPDNGLSVYAAQNTGAITARRSDLWRTCDTLWALHIMDWRTTKISTIILVTAITLISVIAGFVVIPYRIKFRGKRRVRG